MAKSNGALYGVGMDDQGDIARGAPRHWVEALDRAEAEVAAGLAVDGAAVRQRLRDSVARMEAAVAPKAGATTRP
jgi:hypothetical protein